MSFGLPVSHFSKRVTRMVSLYRGLMTGRNHFRMNPDPRVSLCKAKPTFADFMLGASRVRDIR